MIEKYAINKIEEITMNKLCLIGLTAAVACGLAACVNPGKVTGGGQLISTHGDEEDRSNFGFNAERCDLSQPTKGRFNYVDQSAGVKMNGNIVDAALCNIDPANPNASLACVIAIGLCGNPSYGFQVDYRSTNPKFPGNGTAFGCAVDNGEGVNAASSDIAAVTVADGPFAGYQKIGSVQGNIQAQKCN